MNKVYCIGDRVIYKDTEVEIVNFQNGRVLICYNGEVIGVYPEEVGYKMD